MDELPESVKKVVNEIEAKGEAEITEESKQAIKVAAYKHAFGSDIDRSEEQKILKEFEFDPETKRQLLEDFDDYASEVVGCRYDTMQIPLKRFLSLLDTEPLLKLLSVKLPNVDFDSWYSHALEPKKRNVSRMAGSLTLNWPEDIFRELAYKKELFKKMAYGKITVSDYCCNFMYVKGDYHDEYSEFIDKLFHPFRKELRKLIERIPVKQKEEDKETLKLIEKTLDSQKYRKERKYQVFISSTYKDLVAEKEAAIRSVLELGNIPTGMEYFGARSENTLDLINGFLDYCDFYILILKGRYGSVTSSGVGYTETEYDFAVEKNMRILTFVFDGDLLVKHQDEKEELKKKFQDFKSKVMNNDKPCDFFKTEEDLANKIKQSIYNELMRDASGGWVRADVNNFDAPLP